MSSSDDDSLVEVDLTQRPYTSQNSRRTITFSSDSSPDSNTSECDLDATLRHRPMHYTRDPFKQNLFSHTNPAYLKMLESSRLNIGRTDFEYSRHPDNGDKSTAAVRSSFEDKESARPSSMRGYIRYVNDESTSDKIWEDDEPLNLTPIPEETSSEDRESFQYDSPSNDAPANPLPAAPPLRDVQTLRSEPMRGYVRYLNTVETNSLEDRDDFECILHPNHVCTEPSTFNWDDDEPVHARPMRTQAHYLNDGPSTSAGTRGVDLGWDLEEDKEDVSTDWANINNPVPTPRRGLVIYPNNDEPTPRDKPLIGAAGKPERVRLGRDRDSSGDESSGSEVPVKESTTSAGGCGDVGLREKRGATKPIPMKPGKPSGPDNRTGNPVCVKRSTEYYISDSDISIDFNDSVDEVKDDSECEDFVNSTFDAKLSDPKVVDVCDTVNLVATLNESPSQHGDSDAEKKIEESFTSLANNISNLTMNKSSCLLFEDNEECVDNNKRYMNQTYVIRGGKWELEKPEKSKYRTETTDNCVPTTTNNSLESKDNSTVDCAQSVSGLNVAMSSLSTCDDEKRPLTEAEFSKIEAESVFDWIQKSYVSEDLTYNDYRLLLVNFKSFLVQHKQFVDTSEALEPPEKADGPLAALDMSELMSNSHVQFMEFFDSYQETMFSNEQKPQEVKKKYVYNKTYAEWYSEKVRRIAKQKAMEKIRKEEEEKKKLASEKSAKEEVKRSFDVWKRKKNIARMEKLKLDRERKEREHLMKIAAKDLKAQAAQKWRKAKNLELIAKRHARKATEDRLAAEKTKEMELKKTLNKIQFDLLKEKNKNALKPQRGVIPTSSKKSSTTKNKGSTQVKKPWVGPLDPDHAVGRPRKPKPGPSAYRR